ncbi:MAG: hypothetical protein Q7N87_00775 [Candidatus Uhrbacteria bacterium]|nr:hypothetical protein [Candidatus Uhrbacteria bacterium]
MLKEKALGLTVGIFCGVWWLVLMMYSLSSGYGKELIMLVGPMHPGFSYSAGGAIWMAILHFIVGYILGHLFAWVYNRFAK